MLRRDRGEAYLKDGVFVESSVEEEIPVKGSLQPYREGAKKSRLPEGVSVKDAYLFYTKTKLVASDEILKTDADETIIDGVRYEIYEDSNWSRYGLKTDHYAYLLLRKNKT